MQASSGGQTPSLVPEARLRHDLRCHWATSVPMRPRSDRASGARRCRSAPCRGGAGRSSPCARHTGRARPGTTSLIAYCSPALTRTLRRKTPTGWCALSRRDSTSAQWWRSRSARALPLSDAATCARQGHRSRPSAHPLRAARPRAARRRRSADAPIAGGPWTSCLLGHAGAPPGSGRTERVHRAGTLATSILCGRGATVIEPPVTRPRKRSSAASCSTPSPAKRSRSDAGRCA